MGKILEIALAYIGRGWAVVPLLFRSKQPSQSGWPELQIDAQNLAEYFTHSEMNIGVRTGEPSGGLTDVDVDDPLALRLADHFLPSTEAEFGRQSKPRSHRLYVCAQPPRVKRFSWTDEQGRERTLVELRGSGGQTMFPGSVHPSGEAVEWRTPGEPTRITAAELQRACSNLAAAALLAGHYPEGGVGKRHKLSLALSRVLLTSGWKEGAAKHFIRSVAEAAGDPNDRTGDVASTAKNLEVGQPTTGLPSLERLVGGSVVHQVLAWLCEGGEVDASGQFERRVWDARLKFQKLSRRITENPGAVFDPEYLDALWVLSQHAPAAWAKATILLRKNRISVRDVLAEARRRAQQEEAKRPALTAGEVFDHCPTPSLRIPSSYRVAEDGTYKKMTSNGDCRIALAPLLISEKLHELDTGTLALRVHWLRPTGGWQEQVVDRRVLLDSKRIVELAATGFPVCSETARPLSSYFNELEGYNWASLPTATVSSHLGWQGEDGESGFLCGRTLVSPTGELIVREHGQSVCGGDGRVSFRGQTPGDDQIADGYRSCGTAGEWAEALARLSDHPRALIVLYASFAPPLLAILKCLNFVIDLWQRTSVGKTTCLRIAASVWGNPNENEPDSVVHSWDSTNVFVERAATILSGLPLILDETKRVKDPKTIARVLYGIANGQGRGRGDVKSTARTGHYQTVALSTGEAPVVSFTEDGGTRGRCLEIGENPFGLPTPESAKMVEELNASISRNYGHAGLRFVQFLLQRRSEWPRLQDEYRGLRESYRQAMPQGIDPAVADRLGAYLAAVGLAGYHAHAALDLPWEFQDPVIPLLPELLGTACDAAGDERALRYVVSWARSNQFHFHGRESGSGSGAGPRSPIAGRWDQDPDWPFLAFYPSVLKKVLQEGNFNPEAILTAWEGRGWLQVDKGRKDHTAQQRIGREKPRLVVIKRQAIDEVEA